MNHINNLSAESELSPKNSMLLRLGLSFGRLCGLNMAKKINGRLIAPKNSQLLGVEIFLFLERVNMRHSC